MCFITCFLICFMVKILAYLNLSSIWFYKIFLVVLFNPDKIFSKRSTSLRDLNRYWNQGYTPVQAYSIKYIILSCYQLHEIIDNGYCRFFNWMKTKFLRQERLIVIYLFRTQEYVFPTLPDDGLLVCAITHATWFLFYGIFYITNCFWCF